MEQIFKETTISKQLIHIESTLNYRYKQSSD